MSQLLDIELVKELVVECGKDALVRQANVKAEFKPDTSYITEIDLSIEQLLSARLKVRYPDYAFVGEEFGRHGDAGAPLWAVDPIDGTTNMVFGLPSWGVSLGLLVDGVPEGGAFYMPATDQLFWAVRGQGSWLNGRRLHVTDRDAFHPEDTMGFTSGAAKMFNVEDLPGRIRCLGSIAGDVCYTGSGAYCSMVGRCEGVVDMAAALCVATEAGCIAEYVTGEPLVLGDILDTGKTPRPFIVAPPRLTQMLRRELKERA